MVAPHRIERFGATERLVHATFGVFFLVLMVTGIVLWLPALSTLLGSRAALRSIHLWSGLGLVAVPVAIAVIGDRAAVGASLRQLARLDRDDSAFLRRRPSRPGRFNGGQKLNAHFSVTAAMVQGLTGVVLWKWPWFDFAWRAGASRLHLIVTAVAVPVIVGHLYLSTLHPTTRASFRGAVDGTVPKAWAGEHHPRWQAVAEPANGPDEHVEVLVEEPDGVADDAAPGAPVGRRFVLVGLGVGVAGILSGSRWLPKLRLPSMSEWRIYNVASSMPSPIGARVVVDGLVDAPLNISAEDLAARAGDERIEDFVCVTGWQVDDVAWRGVRLSRLLEEAGVGSAATHVTFHSRDGVYTDSLSLADARHPGTLLVTEMDGEPLPRRHGGPVRLIVPTMYGYKSVKWVGRVEVTDVEHIGYWQQRGYSRDARLDTSGSSKVFEGTMTTITGLGVAVDVPPGWDADDLPAGGAVIRPTDDPDRVEVAIFATEFAGTPSRSEVQNLLVGVERIGLTDPRYGVITTGATTADVLQANDGSGQRFLFAYLAQPDRVVQVHAQGPEARWRDLAPTFEQMVASLVVI